MPHYKEGLETSKHLGAWIFDLYDGKDITLTIQKVIHEEVMNESNQKSMMWVAYFKENIKPMPLNSVNCKTLSKLYASPFTEAWEGKKITIYKDKVKVAREIKDCIRIRNEIPGQAVCYCKCEVCGKDILPIANMTSENVSKYTKSKYGKSLCSECAVKAKEEFEKQESTIEKGEENE